MVQGVYVPEGQDGQIVAVLEKFAESLIDDVAECLWEDGDGHVHERSDEAERILAEALRRFLRHGDWRTYA